ncbi:hypothetical protein BC828DRAFT_392173 [Blastocladiella britannica]|nr:hypothetical protein BC828DRAFT_392173 [Blastocladiella britannica]
MRRRRWWSLVVLPGQLMALLAVGRAAWRRRPIGLAETVAAWPRTRRRVPRVGGRRRVRSATEAWTTARTWTMTRTRTPSQRPSSRTLPPAMTPMTRSVAQEEQGQHVTTTTKWTMAGAVLLATAAAAACGGAGPFFFFFNAQHAHDLVDLFVWLAVGGLLLTVDC